MEGGGNRGQREVEREGPERETVHTHLAVNGWQQEGEPGGKGGAREGDSGGVHLHLHWAARGCREGGLWVCTHTCSKEMAGARGREGEG